jgi:hypothetical protein
MFSACTCDGMKQKALWPGVHNIPIDNGINSSGNMARKITKTYHFNGKNVQIH